MARFRVSQYHLKTSQRGTLYDGHSDTSSKASELFFKDEHDLERLKPCLAGTYAQEILPKNQFRKVSQSATPPRA
jgi:hypothetical protein